MSTAANVRKTGDLTATATANFAWTLAGGINWKYTADWTFTRATPQADWRAKWAATMINPQLDEAQSVALRSLAPASGSILDRNQQQILSPTTIYSVVAMPDKVGDRAATAAALARTPRPDRSDRHRSVGARRADLCDRCRGIYRDQPARGRLPEGPEPAEH